MAIARSTGHACAAAIAAALFAGCATTGPPMAYSMHALALCPSVSVANAPPAGPDRRLLAYSPIMAVRGLLLARAPVKACLSSGFGPRTGGAGSVHEGVDLYTGAPSDVLAGGDGRVVSTGEIRGYGLTIEIDHGRGVATRYAHLSSVAPTLRAGSRVLAGDIIARTGKSGNATAVHLHYEILIDRRPVDPLRVGG